MNLKILCDCGTKFSFDVEPVEGRMPVNIACPRCGVDVTNTANTLIEQTLVNTNPGAVETSEKPRRLHVVKVVTPVVAAEENFATSATPRVEMCHRHVRAVAVDHCVVCRKPICAECMQSFGFLCSVNCRYRAEQENIRVPVYKLRRDVVERGASRKIMAIAGVVALFIGALIALWFWYILSGSKPRPFYTLKLPSGQESTYARFLGPSQILLLKKNEISLHDIKSKKNRWSTALSDPKSSAPKTNALIAAGATDESDYSENNSAFTAPFFTRDEVWICLGHNVICVDLKNGGIKHTIPFPGRLNSFTTADSTALVVSEEERGKKRLTQINVASGESKTADVSSSLREQIPAGKDLPDNVLPTAALLMQMELEGQEKNHPSIYKLSTEFIPTGRNLVEMQVKLLELKIAVVQTMKPAGPSKLNENTSASTSARSVLEEINNDQKRATTGGFKRVDESRYAVTLRRLMEGDSPDWTGEVSGLPIFFPAKTVDLLFSGKTLHLFDKQNKKIGESQLSYSIDERFNHGFRASGTSPCLETNNTLFVFDKGVLTALELPSGKVRWRLVSVGISGIQFDQNGMLYVNSTTGSPEDIQFSEQIKINDAVKSLLLKVDPTSGKTLWKTEQTGGNCFLTGKYVYLTDASRGGFAMANAIEDSFGVTGRGGSFSIYRLNPSTGKTLWDFHRAGGPSNFDFANNRILLHYDSDIDIFKFLSF
ncbi:MAG: PQQ-binding-like beta-propeller repeat protein [Verrucomicrobiota bacterium]